MTLDRYWGSDKTVGTTTEGTPSYKKSVSYRLNIDEYTLTSRRSGPVSTVRPIRVVPGVVPISSR